VGPGVTAARGPGRPGYDRDTVLRRSIALFNEQGYDATSVGDLAQHLGVTKSALYHHFASKESILEAALDEALDGLGRAVSGAVAGARDGSAYERLRATLDASVHILVAHLPAVTLLLRVRGNSPTEKAALERRRRIDEELAVLVAEAVEEGRLRSDLDADLVSRLMFGMVNSLVEWWRPDGPLHPDDLAAAVTGVVFDGLRAPRGGAPA
jgi:AcrR family transcriptional regulator